MRAPAEQFLTLRAYGAPPIIVALAAQGAFRGFLDTKTPLYAVGAGNLLNAILDALLIFPLGLGVSGAALATVTSEYLTAFILLWKLNNEVDLLSWNIIGDGIIRYLRSGGLLIGRTIAVFLTLTLATSLATREGPVPMAGYEICLQVWLTISLLNDALALAGQYVMVVLKGSVPMAFGGTQEPAAYGELVSIGGLNPDVNKKLSAGIASILESKLSIPKSRFYLKFHDSSARTSVGMVPPSRIHVPGFIEGNLSGVMADAMLITY